MSLGFQFLQNTTVLLHGGGGLGGRSVKLANCSAVSLFCITGKAVLGENDAICKRATGLTCFTHFYKSAQINSRPDWHSGDWLITLPLPHPHTHSPFCRSIRMSRQIFTTIFTGCSAIWGMSVAFAQVPAPAGNDPRMVQAGALEDQAELNKRLRNQRVRLTADGTLTGRVSSVAGAGVTPLGNFAMTLVQFGEVRGRATSDADGNFRMKSIRPGIYSMIGASASGYLCYGVEVVAADAIIGVLSERAPDKAVPVAFQEVRNDVEIDTLTVPPRDFPAVGELIRGYLPPGLTDLDVNRARVMSAERRDIQLPEEGLKLQPENAALRYHQVQVVDGAVTGRMRRIHPTTGRPQRIRRLNVFLVRDGRVVSQAPVAESGFFTRNRENPRKWLKSMFDHAEIFPSTLPFG